MGNENEIKKDVVEVKSQFLPEDIQDMDSQAVLYSLEEEFAKTKKNKNIFLYLFLLVFIGVSVAGTIFYTSYLDKKNRDIDINIEDFDDLRLKDLIDSARKFENNADLMVVQLDMLEIQMYSDILSVRKRYHNRELALLAKHLPDKETNEKLQTIRKAEENAVERVRRKYAAAMRQLRYKIAKVLQEKRKSEKSIGGNKYLTNEERLHNLKMKRLKNAQRKGIMSLKKYLTKYREFVLLKYNPRYKDAKLNNILDSDKYNAERRLGTYDERYDKIFRTNRSRYNSEFTALKKKIESLDLLLYRLQKVPYENSVSPTLRQMDYLTKSILYQYELQVRRKNRSISDFNNVFDYILKEKPESGYVLNVKSKNNIALYLNRVLTNRVKNGVSAIIFRDEDEYIGKIRIYRYYGGFRGEVVEEKKKIRPFDKILLEIKK